MSEHRSTTSKTRAIVVGVVVCSALSWLPLADVGAARAADDPRSALPERRLEQARPDRGQAAGAADAVGSGPDARPLGWPTGLAVPDAVRAADERLAAARDALRRARLGLDAEVAIAPTARLTKRDDPPRPLETELTWGPKASLSWSPLRSEALLAEARVLEAEADRIAAWRDATLAALRTPVALARLEDAVAAAEHDLDAARRRRADAEAAIAADVATDELAALERRRAAAGLDVREARIDVDEARRELLELRAGTEDTPLRSAAERRLDLPLPPLPEPTATRAYRARALRLAADVARSERRWRKAVLPRLGLEVGYAGSDGSLAAKLELRDGRPRGRLSGAIRGTRQERGWATVSALFRLGSDLPSAVAGQADARQDERRTLEQLEAAWTREAVARWEDARTARARWQVAEARRATVAPDDERGRVRALEAARRSWLRYLVALDKVTTLAETWPDPDF